MLLCAVETTRDFYWTCAVLSTLNSELYRTLRRYLQFRDEVQSSISRSKSSTETTSKLAFHLKWYANWRIRVNETKSKHITFTLERQTSPPPILDNNPGPQFSKKLKAFSFLYLDHKVLLYNKYLAHYNWDSVVPPTRKYTQGLARQACQRQNTF